MRIALVSEHASPLAVVGGADAGGQNVHVAALATALVRLGHQVTVHTRRDDPSLSSVVVAPGGYLVHHVDAGPPAPLPKDSLLPHMAAFARELLRAWARERPDVAHAHFWMSGLATMQAAACLGTPVAVTFHALGSVKQRHQGAADSSPAGRIEVERQLVREADRVIATCTDEVDEIARLGGDRTRIAVVPCGVDTAHFGPRGVTWPKGSAPRLLSIARLVPRKGLLDVIAALPAIPGAELLVAGGSPDPADEGHARALADWATAQGVADRVHLLGAVSRRSMPALIRSADIVVQTPWYEPFGIVPLEAMATARPVVASAVGGLTDTVLHGRTGLLVQPRNPRAIALAVRHLLTNDDLRTAMGARGLKRSRRYSWDRIAQQTIEVYAGMLAARAPSTADRDADARLVPEVTR